MADCIHLLPDAVANQIAAGEVIQRPASIVKELVENSVDAGAKKIIIIIKDAGKTLVQVIDDGEGMSETDARLAFERHATSKITKAEDLFSIQTKGFRGEALASIAAVASVELKTRKKGESVGTRIRISASEVELQEPDACPEGTNFAVKNLFFNIPARRKFLKSDQTELRHIISEIQRVALAHPEIKFKLSHNNQDILNLETGNVKQRIVGIFGRNMDNNLIDIKIDTDIVRLRGYIGKPEKAKRTTGEQYFFVNRRYMRHAYFFKAVTAAYDRLIQDASYPQFFIYFDVDTDKIDVNIHPTKTEIKFTEERAIYQILHASIKEALGKFNMVPSLDFEKDETLNIYSGPSTGFKAPEIEVNPDFNPFEAETRHSTITRADNPYFEKQRNDLKHWETLYPNATNPNMDEDSSPSEKLTEKQQFFQIKKRYIITTVKSGMMLIDQARAHERILYEQFVEFLSNRKGIVQKQLYPKHLKLNPEDFALAFELIEKLNDLGFDIRVFGDNSFVINGLPADLAIDDSETLMDELLENYKSHTGNVKLALDERIAYAMAKTSAGHFIRPLKEAEMQHLFYRLMACKIHNYTPSGKNILSIISVEELQKRLK
jgi:DNA mismatch repair protein MutL